MQSQGKLYIIGIGPGSVDHLTFKAKEAIKSSEYIIGNDTYLNLIAEIIDEKKLLKVQWATRWKEAKRHLNFQKKMWFAW